ncbi:MAG TPA: hypothetical protein VMF08_18915 [Candidatus Sulfotelmatobacter sp.]|nr:hypothetical protein [Candidatus Sulfotelmatobacter sp.]
MNSQNYSKIGGYCMKLGSEISKLYVAAKRPQDLVDDMNKLYEDLNLLGKAWSPMAEGNLLNDLLRDLAKIEQRKDMPRSVRKICTDAKQKIAGFIRGCNVTNARYDSVLCLGYRVQTSFPKYDGKPDDWTDMKEKCDKLKEAIQSAYHVARDYNANNRILKVFMAPEFYFRGKNGAYLHEVIIGNQEKSSGLGGKKGLMDLMGEEVDKDVYKHWLFVFGTAIAAAQDTQTVCDCGGPLEYVRDKKTNKPISHPGTNRWMTVCTRNPAHTKTREKVLGARIDNVALVRKEKEVHLIFKELISHIDFIKDKNQNIKDKVTVKGTELNVLRVKQDSGYNAANNGQPKFQDERMGGNIFTVDGVTFGLEVCLDHAATTSTGAAGRLEHAANIQVQLIPSAGMSISKLRTLPGGVVFNVDGSQPHIQVYGTTVATRTNVSTFESRQIGSGNVETRSTRNAGAGWGPGQKLDANKRLNLGMVADGAVLMYGPYTLPSTMPQA